MTGLREWINSHLSAGKGGKGGKGGGQPGGNRANVEISPQRAPEDPVHLGYAERVAEVESAAREVRDRERSTAYGARLKPHPSVAATGHVAVMSPRQIREAHAARMMSDEEFEERYRQPDYAHISEVANWIEPDPMPGVVEQIAQAMNQPAVQFEGFSGGEGGGGGASFDMSAAGDSSADSSSSGDSSDSSSSSSSSDSSSSSSDSSDSSNSGGGDL